MARADHPRSPLRSLQRLVHGPPVALPGSIDRVSERWAAAPPRLRAAVVVITAFGVLASAGWGAARSPWGSPVAVLVASGDLAAGHVVTPEDVTEVTWPAAVAPDPAVGTADAVVGRALASAVPAGAPITAAHLSESGLASLLPPHRVALAVPMPDGPTAQAGQRLDLLAGDGSGGGRRLATGAVVLRADEEVIWVAVDRDDAPTLAGALAWGEVTVALLADGEATVGG
jgi:pilus assembly protein CpaB